MAHPYKDKVSGGQATAKSRYAEGGEVENVATKIARGVNTIRRGASLPPNKGAISVQQNADMIAADRISDAVPRKGLNMEPARKSGGKVK